MSRRFTPTEDYLIFLELLVQARRDAGVSKAELAQKTRSFTRPSRRV